MDSHRTVHFLWDSLGDRVKYRYEKFTTDRIWRKRASPNGVFLQWLWNSWWLRSGFLRFSFWENLRPYPIWLFMKVTSYLSDETIRKISDLIAQDLINAYWLGFIKDKDLLDGKLSVEITRWEIRLKNQLTNWHKPPLIFVPFCAILRIWIILIKSAVHQHHSKTPHSPPWTIAGVYALTYLKNTDTLRSYSMRWMETNL